ncbi:MAG TPA: anhydro-N-acetylmuramic acid kinase, partial [Verrucomicrobiota bacterium]|nr:anhydro-N-acetylmuramic acid kinase [Verrucomicrobiota bacterium]
MTKRTPLRDSQRTDLALGIMSGTSVDGVDCALCAVTDTQVKLRRHWQVSFPKRLRERIVSAANGRSGSWEVAQLHHDLGRFYASAVRSGLGQDRPMVIGLHGQTIFHSPTKRNPAT